MNFYRFRYRAEAAEIAEAINVVKAEAAEIAEAINVVKAIIEADDEALAISLVNEQIHKLEAYINSAMHSQ